MALARNPVDRRGDAVEETGYASDFYGWALRQAALLRAGQLDRADLANVAEEIEGLARSEFNGLVSFLKLILAHMLKFDHQPSRRSRSWAISIALHREHAQGALADNPSFLPQLDDALDRSYRQARLLAARETRLPLKTFPETRPYNVVDVFDRPFPIDA